MHNSVKRDCSPAERAQVGARARCRLDWEGSLPGLTGSQLSCCGVLWAELVGNPPSREPGKLFMGS